MSFKPSVYNRKNVMNDTNGSKGICKYVNDEIYMSKVCLDSNKKDTITVDNKTFTVQKITNNPQQAYYDDGRYYFDFPAIWYNANSVNKAIGLRSIDIYTKPLTLKWSIKIQYTDVINVEQENKDFIYSVQTKETTEDIISGMTFLMNQWLTATNNDVIKFYYSYDIKGTVKFTLSCVREILFGFQIYNISDSFITLFGNNYTTTDSGYDDYFEEYRFKNVWNRRDLFIHASFVNYTSFNYLGKNGEFYPKISKIYDFCYPAQKFYFEISFDGMNPVKFEDVDFIVGLCLIVDEKKYNGE